MTRAPEAAHTADYPLTLPAASRQGKLPSNLVRTPTPTNRSERRPSPAREKPLLLVDIDGVISLFGSPEFAASSGAVQRAGRAASRAASTRSTASPTSFRPRPPAPARPGRLFDIVWASGWEEKAERVPSPSARAARPAAVPRFARSPGSTRSPLEARRPSTRTPAGGRWPGSTTPSTPPVTDWAGRVPAPTLLVHTAPEHGLTSHETRS